MAQQVLPVIGPPSDKFLDPLLRELMQMKYFGLQCFIVVCIYRLVMISIKWSETAQKTHWPARM